MLKIADIIIRRLGLGLVTLFFVSVLIFISVNSLPGDFAQEILGQGATPEAVAAIRAEIGLDRPIYERYFDWLFATLLCFDWPIYLFGAYYWGRATACIRMHTLFNFRYYHWLFAILLYVTINQNYYLSSEKVKKYHTTPQESYQKNKSQYTKKIKKTKVKKIPQ